ncbi:pantoate--beta-alanine ligase [Nocardioides limicola]|uniref:pantoate--beta-alanine ligase n=1 Tax=Nocardioides limicola TaxID=2803368 RepID=UPI00193BEE34|nr:pantoate--beta-alanine ligase [Nocardioides sp. DJM-14]
MSDQPLLVHTRTELADALAPARSSGQRVGFVPTMGALHQGHASLMRVAREHVHDGPVVVSIFVNPTQFAAGEDLDRYPRTLDADLELCAAAGVDVLFAPTTDEMYPAPGVITVDPGPAAEILEGASRPTHFRGVLTVVAKLFGLVRPDVAVFGEKDYQQLALITAMAADLCTGVEIVGAETVREPDGLALSSRNRYLGPERRRRAVALSQALYAAQRAAPYGLDAAWANARAELRSAHGVDLDYLEILSPDLTELPAEPEPGTPARILIAARVGTTRLIDNMPLTLGAATAREPSGGGDPTSEKE